MYSAHYVSTLSYGLFGGEAKATSCIMVFRVTYDYGLGCRQSPEL